MVEDPALLRLLWPDDKSVCEASAGQRFTVGRGDPSFTPDVRLSAGPDAVVDVSAIALEIFCHSTNFAIRVHQRPPGYLVAVVTDPFTERPNHRTVSANGLMLDSGSLTDLRLRLGDGPSAVELPVGQLHFQAEDWQHYGAGVTNVVRVDPPREQWVRWLVVAHELWQQNRELARAGRPPRSCGSDGIPSESSVKDALKQRFPQQWPTTNPAEPKRAVTEALHHYGLHQADLRNWHNGLRALFSQGWPRESLISWVDKTGGEAGWAPVGLGGRQGPRNS